MKNYIMGVVVLAGVMFITAPTTTQAAGLTQTQIQAVISLLQVFGADPTVIQSASKAMGLADNSAAPVTTKPTSTGPQFSVKSINANAIASSSTVFIYPEVFVERINSKPLQPTKQILTETLGSYELVLEVTAGNEAVSIPMTTTDSAGGTTGISYSLIGQGFKGSQTSNVVCSNYGDKKCLIPAGKTKSIKVAVLLNPSESGNYGVSFDKVNYLLGQSNQLQNWSIKTQTNTVYVK